MQSGREIRFGTSLDLEGIDFCCRPNTAAVLVDLAYGSIRGAWKFLPPLTTPSE